MALQSNSVDPAYLFPFPLDAFQLEAIGHLDEGRSVVVCAPTGSGKTVIAEYAVHRAVAQGKRVFYTTPLKALSNQKFRDFCDIFSPDLVGLLTGDISINRQAAVVVMTTEIFRNMLYNMPMGEMGTSLEGLQVVILDECHYMNDSQRGTVWEESIIYCPNDIQMVALSATIANAGQLTDWIDRVHGPTRLVYSDFRPVPLRHHFCERKGLTPLLNEQKSGLHPTLRPYKKAGAHIETTDPQVVVSHLASRDMLPAIYFIFSRRGCDEALTKVKGLKLVNTREQAQLREHIDEFLRVSPDGVRGHQLEALYNGMAVHHAGVLPLWKGLVEQLFQQGLIKVVFATETLAAGINMPARTTVIGMLSKRTDTGHRTLHASEFLQMAGRAGRRGMDPVGHVVVLPSPFESAHEAARLVLSESDPLVSQFTPSYGMVLNLLERHTLESARTLIERSFGQYLATLHLEPLYEERRILMAEQEELHRQVTPITEEDLTSYEKLRGKLKATRRIAKTLEHQAQEGASLHSGALLLVRHPQKKQHTLAVLVENIPFDPPLYACLSQDNQWLMLDDKYLITYYPQTISLPAGLVTPSRLPMQAGTTLVGGEPTKAIARLIPPHPLAPASAPSPGKAQVAPPEVADYQRMIQDLEAQIEAHPAHNLHRKTWEKHFERVQKLEHRLDQLTREFADQGEYYWLEFLKLVRLLDQFGFLEQGVPSEKGRVAASLRGDNELWLGLALLSGELDHLTPAQLAAVCCALVSEPPRPHSWVTVMPCAKVEDATEGLRQVRRDLLKRQRRQEVYTPAWLETKLTGLVEQWASGLDWSKLVRLTNLDEGDLVRLLRRTLDLLRQIPYTPGLSRTLTQAASQAQQLMDRPPVSEVL
ncbi:DEAD/DEAH box helicase [Anthocerotibacter panamensis]|uniref:DEAD/DEAH box helicase n=1 Tax=Anthocerotibacter panamensis TaxID=2857077 RepID=UPI001C403C66|nr:DEAD/DEAH box helicase [Anthocerotibacter panamensis]